MTAESIRKACWVMTDGGIGMVNQALGLAEALGCAPIDLKTVRVKALWRWLPPRLWPVKTRWPFAALDIGSDEFSPPWPDLTISCGARSGPIALAVRYASQGYTRAIHVQNPIRSVKDFDFVIAPAHDRLEGANVFQTQGAIGRATPERLQREAKVWYPQLAALPHPLVLALIGGGNGRYHLTPQRAEEIGITLARFARDHKLSLLVTPSRRTGDDNCQALRRGLGDAAAVFWDREGENPYYGWLGSADGVIVTEDSVNMVTEACATGKPIFILRLGGQGSAKFRRFHAAMQAKGYTQPFTGKWYHWSYTPLDEAKRAADFIRGALGWP